MAPLLVSLGAAALALASNAAAAQWQLQDTYNSTNFFDKFDFMDFNDPNGGFVDYLSREKAIAAKLATVKNNEVVLRVDNKSKVSQNSRGRGSVRLESKAKLNEGLMIARFSHLPKSACGTWPAVWTVGDSWPQDGEVDIFESWNLRRENNPAFHMADVAKYGECTIDGADQSGKLLTKNCDNEFSDGQSQWPNQGCVVEDTKGPAGGDGGVYAMEWTSEHIKVFSWFPNKTPSNIDSSSPDTSLWGEPMMYLKKDLCNVDQIFKNQRIILNIAMCGNPLIQPAIWEDCGKKHKTDCNAYVSENPKAFDDVYFQIQDIRIFEEGAPKTTSIASASTTMTSSSPSTSETSAISSQSSPANNTSAKTTSASTSVLNTLTLKSSNSTSSTVSNGAANTTVPAVTTTQAHPASTTSAISLSTKWPESTIASSVEMTTSTVYTTSTSTISSCKPTVTNCPVGQVTTVTVPLYITVCPVSAVEAKTSGPKPTKTPGRNGNASDKTTITTKITKTYTITSCAPTVTDCSTGAVSTKVFTTTYCPDEETPVPTGSNSGNSGNDSNGHDGNNDSGNGDNSEGSHKATITTKITKTYTITSCAPTVTNCSTGAVSTKVFTTTYCPDEKTPVPTGSNSGNGSNGHDGNGGNASNGHSGNNGNASNGDNSEGSDKTTIITKVTKTYTITSCAPTATDCSTGAVSTKVFTTTYLPDEKTHPAGAAGAKGEFNTPSPFHPSKTGIYNTQTMVPQPAKTSGGNSGISDDTSNGAINGGINGTSIVQPRPSASQVCVGPSCGAEPGSPTPNSNNGNNGNYTSGSTDNSACTGPNCHPVIVSGAARHSLSTLVVLGAVAAMML